MIKDLYSTIMRQRRIKTEETKDTLPSGGAKRFNKRKLRWRNMPMWLFEPVIEVSHAGEKKYGTYNYLNLSNQKEFTLNGCLDSMKRHLKSFESPYESDFDQEMSDNLGKPVYHLAAAVWNGVVALHIMIHHPELDDRYKPPKKE